MPNVNVEQDIHKRLRARAAAENVPLHAVVNEVLRAQVSPRPTVEFNPVGRRRATDLRATAGQNLVWMLVWRDAIDPSVVWRAPVRVTAAHADSLIATIDGGEPFIVTLDSVVDAVEAFPTSGGKTQGDFAEADRRARGAYLAWRNSGARPVPGRHTWSDLG